MAEPTSEDFLASPADAGGDPAFSVSLRGYNRREVDEYVRELRLRARRQADALREAERRLEELGADASVPLQVVGSGGIGARVERIIALAESEAAEIREQAETDASRMRTEVEEEADKARRFREQAAKASAAESRAMIANAEKEVAKLRETRHDLLTELAKIGEAVDEITEKFTEPTAPEPRRPETSSEKETAKA